MEILDIFGVHVEEYLNLVGVVDTQVLVEDAWDGTLPESLSGLVLKYNQYDSHFSKKPGANGGKVFSGAHHAGNDAIATLQGRVCIVPDSLFGTSSYDDGDEDGSMADVVTSATADVDECPKKAVTPSAAVERLRRSLLALLFALPTPKMPLACHPRR